jgi:uncharacterized protein (TIGR00730 family)
MNTLPADRKRITVFGGSRCGPDSEEYQEAIKLGRGLAEGGFEVCTGGYSGIMEAISRGAREAGGHVIGVTMQQFKSAPNKYLNKIEPSADFYARLQTLIGESAGYVALRGGMGTVTEVSLVWNKLTTGILSPRPLVLLGNCWVRAMECLRQQLVISDEDLSHLSFVPGSEEAISLLRARLR